MILYGAGQAGIAAAKLLGVKYAVSCFADDDPALWGSELLNIPVLSPEESLLSDADCCCICADEPDRADDMEKRYRFLGFDGTFFHYDISGTFDPALAAVRFIADQIHQYHIPGDVAELGAFKGDFSVHLNFIFSDRRLHIFDSFEGLDARDTETDRQKGFSDASAGDFSETGVSVVWKRLIYPEMSEFYKGYFPASFPRKKELVFAFVCMDAKLYAPTAAGLPIFYDRLSPGGAILVRSAGSLKFRGPAEAVKEFCTERDLFPDPVADTEGSVIIRKR